MSNPTIHLQVIPMARVTHMLSFLVLAVCTIAWQAQAQAEQPNVLFLICDDLNCDLGAYGHPLVQSPNIDRLARRGVLFERAYCQYPLCGPSRASFLTGLYPDQTLVRRNAIYIREHVPNVETLPQAFRASGYFATRIGKLFHYNVPKHIGTSGHDDPYSWNYTINPRGRDKEDESQIFSLVPGSFGGTLSWLAADGTDEEQTDGIAATEAAEQLQRFAASKRPFFLAVGLFRPHTPYVAPKKYFDMYPRENIHVPSVPDDYLETLPADAVKSITRKVQHQLTDDMARQAMQAYYASITFADAQVGRILDALEANGLSENTVVLFTSDHGYHMGEHGHWQKTTLFENAARVPLILAGPGITAQGQKASSPVEMVDFYPTLTELCGVASPKYISGKSLVPTLVDSKHQVRESALTQYANGYSVVTNRFRYTAWGEDGAAGAELYDHHTDPDELVNLLANGEQHPQAAELAKLLQARVAQAAEPPEGVRQNRADIQRKVPQPND